MKKHLFAFICVFIILFNTFTYTKTKAMDIGVAIDVGSESLYEGWDMIQSIFNGFVISLGQYSGYADKASAMAAFYNDWGDVLTVLTQGYLSPDQVEQSAISLNTVYPLDFGMTGAVMRDFINQYGNFVYDPTLGVYADINQKSIAAWNRFNDGWVKRYQDAFQRDLDQHPTYADPDYAAYINNINSVGFWFKNYPSSNEVTQSGTTFTFVNGKGSFSNYSWYAVDNGYFNSSTQYAEKIIPSDIATIYINSNNGVYSFTSTFNGYSYQCQRWQNGSLNYTFPCFSFDSSSFFGSNSFVSYNKTFTYSGTLAQVLNYIGTYIRNVNIYVDDVLWAYVGHVQEPITNLSPDHPMYDENGQIIGNDVFFPEQDLKADIVKFTELIDDKILTGDTIDLDDLIDAGVLTDAEGNIITDENRDQYIKKRDIATVITDALDDDSVVADLLPDAPNPPDDDPWNWNFPTIVIPEGGDPDPRGTGLSVLARIINVTNQSLPAEVITMFWGICITLIILGIIKILHK